MERFYGPICTCCSGFPWFLLFLAAVAYFLLAQALTSHHGKDSALAKALGSDLKGKISLIIYAAGIGLCFINPWIGFALYVVVAIIWFIPDKRIEDKIADKL